MHIVEQNIHHNDINEIRDNTNHVKDQWNIPYIVLDTKCIHSYALNLDGK